MSAFMTTAPSGIVVYLPNGQQSKIAGYGDTVEAVRLGGASSNPNPGASGVSGSGVISSVNGATALQPVTTGVVLNSPANAVPPAPAPIGGALLAPTVASGALFNGLGQNMLSGITTFPGISSAAIIAATPGLQAQITAGTVIVVQA